MLNIHIGRKRNSVLPNSIDCWSCGKKVGTFLPPTTEIKVCQYCGFPTIRSIGHWREHHDG